MRALLLLFLCVGACFVGSPAGAQSARCPHGSCALAAFPALAPTVLAGGEEGVRLLAEATGLAPGTTPLVPLATRLTAEQEALLGCGPFWGTECEADGIDLLAAEAGVLQQSWVGFEGAYTRSLPGARFLGDQLVLVSRSPFLPDGVPNLGYDVSGVSGLVIPAQFGASAGWHFASEMAALSFNTQLLLIAFSSGDEGPPGADPSAFDPSNPYARYDPSDPSTAGFAGKCSFLQPQYCSAIQAFFDVTHPSGAPPVVDVPPAGRVVLHGKRRRGCLAAPSGLAEHGRRHGTRGRSARAGRCRAR